MWNSKRMVTLLAGAVLLASSCAMNKAETLPSYSNSAQVTTTATVEAIDQATREVTLKLASGEQFSFVAGEAVKNLDQVRVGDQVKAVYAEAIAIEVRRADGSVPTVEVGGQSGTAAKGDKPAAGVVRELSMSASIEAIDRTNLRVTVKGPQGNLRILQIKDPKKLENVQVGDMVYMTYAEAVGISVEKVAP